MRILLLGSSGLLGHDCKEVLGNAYEVIAPNREELDIINWDVVIEKMQKVSPDIVLNCAAFTDVDACEKEHFKVRKVNLEGPRNLAQGSARFNCKVVHISSDYVFDGKKSLPQPYFEDDSMEPLSAYGRSKYESEVAVKENAPDYIIVRSGWLYGIKGKDFIKSILNKTLGKKRKTLRVVADQYASPTWSYRLATQIKELIERDAKGTYHATAEGYCTPYELSQYVFKKLNLNISLEPIGLTDYKQLAKRPHNCILENRLLKKQGLNVMVDWKEDVDAFLDEFGKDLVKEARRGKK
ncbi:MAG: dTDP-4-dehydrorhamnose reductase [Deltaproteobacteria bacterium]|nr:dTDP-4-dehydrorhamnose reductase [Deltaproteobacteria bacterium]